MVNMKVISSTIPNEMNRIQIYTYKSDKICQYKYVTIKQRLICYIMALSG